MNPKFTIFQGSNLQYYFHLQARNGEKILASEGYLTQTSCKVGIEAVKLNAPFDFRYDRKTATGGQHYFNLKSSNGQVIGVSEMYSSVAAREAGLNAVKNDAPIANS